MGKEKDLHIRMNEDDFHFLSELCELHKCTKTELTTELIRRGDYTVLNYDGIKDFNKIFGNIGNNINQIARTLNIANKNGFLSQEQYTYIQDIFKNIQSEYLRHQLGSDQMLRKIYRIKIKKEKIKYPDTVIELPKDMEDKKIETD